MKIIMDSREPREIMQPLLEEAGFDVTLQELPAGDYLLPESKMVFSWKSYLDFIQSNHRGHLKDEVAGMYLMGNDYWQGLIVWKYNDSSQKFVRGLNGRKMAEVKGLIEYYNSMYIPVWDVATRSTGIEVMKRWGIKSIDREFPMQIHRNVVVFVKTDPVTARMLQTVKGVGSGLANRIVEKYSSIHHLIKDVDDTQFYDKEKWKTKKAWREANWYHDIDKLGPDKAGNIWRALIHGRDEE